MATASQPSEATRIASIVSMMSRGLRESSAPRVRDALPWLDPERVSSVPGLLSKYYERADTIMRDAMLSEEGKSTQLQAAASSTLGNIASLAKKVADLDTEYKRDAETAVPLPKAEVADAIYDVALAAHIRELEPIPSALTRMSDRVRLAAARAPAELSGITPEVQARVRGSLMDPAKATQLGDEAQAIGAVRQVTQAAIDELAPVAKWQPRELVKSFGAQAGWRLPGVVNAVVALRLAGEGDSLSAEA